MYRGVASGIFLVCFTALNCAAQSTDPAAQPQSPSPAETPAAAPEANTSSSTTSNQTKKKPKKVWTNEEMSSVGGNISVVGDSSIARHNEAARSTNGNTAQRIAAYRVQILQLRGQMDAIDKQIVNFHNAKAGEASTGMDPRLRYTTTSPEDRVKQLEDKKKQLQAKIDAIEEAARKEGIEAGQLR